MKTIDRMICRMITALVKAYQRTISKMLKPSCKYYPSCSEYMIQAVGKYGAFKGTAKGVWRILRCNPFSKGGYDPA